MVKVSIAALIYKSPTYADWVRDSIFKYTPMVRGEEAEFFFVANDPTREVLDHLEQKGYHYLVHLNRKLTEEQLYERGIGAPEYVSRVYRGWNHAIECARGEVVVLVNSDNFFSPGWLESLLRQVNPNRIVCSQLVEREHPRHGVFPGALHGEFGDHPNNFDEARFLEFCRQSRRAGLAPGGAYMPCAFYKDVARRAGLYPEGNVAGLSFADVVAYGDQVFFRNLAALGVEHVTALDSLVYHTKEGEMDEINGTGSGRRDPLGPSGSSLPGMGV